VETIVKQEADEHFVIVLSDANLDRYGIPPRKFAEILTMNDDVNAYVIFIGSLGDQALRFCHRHYFVTVITLLFCSRYFCNLITKLVNFLYR